jgi:dynein heavy chain
MYKYIGLAFSFATQDVQAAREEANDNVRFLKLLRKNLDKLNLLDEFVALVPLFKPIFHTMLLIWKHSKYYNTAARFVTLLQEICNDLIMQVHSVLNLVLQQDASSARNCVDLLKTCEGCKEHT